MAVHVTYLGDLGCEIVHPETGCTIRTDAHHENFDRTGMIFPLELCGAALGACAVTVMGFIARRLDVPLAGTKVTVEDAMTADQHRIASLKVTFEFPAGDYPGKVRRQFARAIAKCPVHASLHPDIEQTFTLVWPDGEKDVIEDKA